MHDRRGDRHLTNAGILLFAEYPPKFMPWARVRVLRYDGVKCETGKRMNIVKDRTFDGPLPKVIDGARAMISEQLRKSSSLCAKTLKGLAEKGVLEWYGSSKNDPSQHYTLAEVRSKTE